MNTQLTFEAAYEKFPACAIGAWDEQETISSLIFAADHELTMYAENQDGCITAKERNQLVRWYDFLRSHHINVESVLRGNNP